MTETETQTSGMQAGATPGVSAAGAQPSSFFGFVDSPVFRRWSLWGLAVVCVGLFAAELLLPAKLHSDAMRIPGKYAAIGFVGVCLAAISGWAVGFLRREPDFYGDAGDRLPEPDEALADWRAEERGR